MTSPTRDEVRAAVERLVAEISIVYAADDPVMHDLRTLIAAAEDGARDAITPVSAQTPAGERERFERWAAALDEPRYENGDYKNDHVQTQWEAWQAALFAGDRS